MCSRNPPVAPSAHAAVQPTASAPGRTNGSAKIDATTVPKPIRQMPPARPSSPSIMLTALTDATKNAIVIKVASQLYCQPTQLQHILM